MDSFFIFIPICYATAGFLQISMASHTKHYSRLSTILCCGVLLLLIAACETIHSASQLSFNFLNYFGIRLNLVFIFDPLSRVMVCTIFIISSCIIRYSHYYLQSDQTQGRFLGQIYLLVASVLLLMLAGNLFTAFIAWQLIGMTLYLLLNHYHYDLAANKAAKKKFIINRIGDVCFLMAIVLVYQHLQVSLFSQLQVLSSSVLVPLLILIAVMTKSAQFPFHIWLPDTLETPTPVSALMHAGIINAGGFLLIRCAPMLNHNIVVLIIIMMVGFTTVVLGNVYMCGQATIKKQLAYSTMAQMGYMVFQCGTGLFSAALFHLIAHGFLKGYLFLNSGSTLSIGRIQEKNKENALRFLLALLVSGVIVAIAYSMAQYFSFSMPLLFLGFVVITVTQLIYHCLSAEKKIILGTSVIIFLLVLSYFFILQQINHYIGLDKFWINNRIVECLLLLALVIVQVSFMVHKHKTSWGGKTQRVGRFEVEAFCRRWLLDPLRILGEGVNAWLGSISKIKLKVAFVLMPCILVAITVLVNRNLIDDVASLRVILSGFFLSIALLSMIVANRASNIAGVVFWLFIFQACISLLPLFHENRHFYALFIYYIVNVLLILLTLYCLLGNNKNNQIHHSLEKYNTLSWPLLYLSVSLIMLIGLPGTASFVGEMYFFKMLLAQSMLLFCIYAITMLLLAVVLMHALQLHVFRLNHSTLSHLRVTPLAHCIFIVMLCVNVFSGLLPQLTITWITKLI